MRDKEKDNNSFNSSDEHEINYIVSLYSNKIKENIMKNIIKKFAGMIIEKIIDRKKDKIRAFLKKSYTKNSINNNTHIEIYKLIEQKFGYTIPD